MADLSDIRHTKCGYSLFDEAGCPGCLELKQELVVDDSALVDPISVVRKSARLLNRIMDRLEYDMRVSGKKAYHREWAKDAAAVSTALSKVVNDLRRFEIDLAVEVSQYSFQEQMNLFGQWFESLPLDQKRVVVRGLTDASGPALLSA